MALLITSLPLHSNIPICSFSIVPVVALSLLLDPLPVMTSPISPDIDVSPSNRPVFPLTLSPKIDLQGEFDERSP